ncbi:RrF2 family transcriptional regulator [Ethanoligenens harbinense]|uniref:Transcriptional regulator, BadM/Rrf2 family n=1 Tax=Ethanoligenens harbinense (strain DSM 18485 / JCM 12961 / CGMCC 1.5033 / YUAN-3) TaxID=663278 RepID=E6U897_ETHHY|nr:Rrf2 family transcriptional regulator [Ethanoligenens harbinense]ADU27116.1 transcriptional regulator, BadM/Rrf2 family [Ethanoligenens harbinense YUAN-3]AVQ96191.1 Rrf2 family transcriptional regulator [Ethanoligenens harbinense YUAN-3]AYF38851.1 Rrf2 family transcriptional regulator [Ethanoligenens harbinense]AYF41601.1 Rrf2 family transcriptional regulator [Ethanoligenens harbinense]QCN92432.1 Rrf2 family transcriptional regulator [Ethanoligenens harbinense]
MRVTQESDYALRVIIFLYQRGIGERVEARVISEKENIPLRFLLKLLRKMAAANIVRSYRGSGGGYAIEKQPSEISVREVIEAVEGPIYVNKCLGDSSQCNLDRTSTCHIHRALQMVQDKLLANLDELTFEQILKLEP